MITHFSTCSSYLDCKHNMKNAITRSTNKLNASTKNAGNGRIKVLSQNDCSNSPFEFVCHIEGI